VIVLRALVAFVRFWVDFIVGDDWTVALAVGLALAGTWALVIAGIPAWWLLPLASITATGVSLRRAATRKGC
jgi:hypothetical protein